MGFVLIGIGSFSSLGTSGNVSMVSHGLIGVVVFSCRATYDRTKTLKLDDGWGRTKCV